MLHRFAITGSLKKMSKSIAAKKLEERGYEFSKKMSRLVDVLIVADDRNGGRDKYEKAKMYGTKMISESEFYKMLE